MNVFKVVLITLLVFIVFALGVDIGIAVAQHSYIQRLNRVENRVDGLYNVIRGTGE